MPYEPTLDSVSGHPVPAWYNDAKLGIFVHWGLYSVPAWAPTEGDLGETQETGQWTEWFASNPYAEWYANSVRISGSPTQRHHFQTYGHGFSYKDFAPEFNRAVESWDPASWASFFKRAGAKYVVLTTKHHDGFLLWPSDTPNPFHEDYHCRRNVVWELASAVRAAGMSMAYYYSGGIDWTFHPQVIRRRQDMAAPQSKQYIDYANAHWYELIEKYDTRILWNDISYPMHTNTNRLFADYYNRMPDGVINNRFHQRFDPPGHAMVPVHFDFTTPEYRQYDSIQKQKWESCRGIGASFGYNRQEGPAHHLAAEDLIHSFIDIVSKNGNLLINVGPTAQGEIPALQRRPLEALGQWLEVNGDAIFGTRPWRRAEDTTQEGLSVRYTRKREFLYAIVLGGQGVRECRIPGLQAVDDVSVEILGQEEAPEVKGGVGGLTVRSARPWSDPYATTLRIRLVPEV